MIKGYIDIYSKDLKVTIPDIEIAFTQLYYIGKHSFRHIITTTDNYLVIPKQNESGFLQAYSQCIEGKRAGYLKEGPIMNNFVDNYLSYRKEYRKRTRMENLLNYRKHDIELRKAFKLESYHQVRRLRKAMSYTGFNVVADILSVNKFRSEYRESLNDQIREWINDKDSEYKTPLSWKQVSSLSRYIRIDYNY